MMRVRLAVAIPALLFALAGCSGIGASSAPGNLLHVQLRDKPAPGAREQKYPVTVRVAPYADGRGGAGAGYLGVLEARVLGLSGKEILLDREVSALVTEVMQNQLGDAGLQVQADAAANAQFQLAGSIKSLNVDIKERDHLNIVIESTLTEISSGRVIWSGVVAEKKERYAGSSGNSKKDIADFLQHGLQVVAGKTSESLLSVLMTARPDLFGLDAGVKPVQGVTVNSTALPSGTVTVAPQVSAAANGTLVLNSIPARAKVYVDDVYYGLAPLRLGLAPGIYAVRLELEGYRPSKEKVSVRSEDHTELELKLHH